VIFCIGGWSAESDRASNNDSALLQQQIEQLKAFSAAKEKQAKTLAEAEGEPIGPDYQQLFDAATRGDVSSVTNLYENFKRRHGQYSRSADDRNRILPHTSFWSPVLEVGLAYDHIANCDPKYTQLAVRDILNSIPRGSIYFGGTDPGRGLPTAFSKSHIDADPFYTLTQNALADQTYLEYMRLTYGADSRLLTRFIEARQADGLVALDAEYSAAWERLNEMHGNKDLDLKGPEINSALEESGRLKARIDDRAAAVWAKVREQGGTNAAATIYTPSGEDARKSFTDYTTDALRRLEAGQLKPGEQVSQDEGRVQVSGQVAVMEINARLAKIVFDKNPEHEFYVEESFPLDWMYPHLTPNGLIMKINREPLARLPDDVVQRDRQYWKRLVGQMIGDWLTEETSIQAIAGFVEKTYVRKDLSGFTGDPDFVRDNYAPKMFSKWRSSIGGIYAWRLGITSGRSAPSEYVPGNEAERQRLVKDAEFAFRQAFVLCPYSPETVFRYVHLLTSQRRTADALLIAETASHLNSQNGALQDLVKQLRGSQARHNASVLEFRLVEDIPSALTEPMTLVVRAAAEGRPELTSTLHVQRIVLMDVTGVQSAGVTQDMLGRPQIEIHLTDAGRERFARITRENMDRKLAIIIDGRLYSAPVIRSEIRGGAAQITGDFTQSEAERLANRINSAIAESQ
jgi:hypothetical protein